MEATKWDNGECTQLQKESLKCLMGELTTTGRRDACQEFFDRYRQCTKERQERLAEERRRRRYG
ncbi:hypothetical protein PINS_up013057 [Pythium insidiosum]|nr:hypothetical protein PINS_up013057 [Pythium insidiosum]